jgi:hypothetical protein
MFVALLSQNGESASRWETGNYPTFYGEPHACDSTRQTPNTGRQHTIEMIAAKVRRPCVSASAFSLVEILAAIMAFTLVFLAGFAGISRLMLTQDQNYARTVAASAVMLIADWHHRKQASGSAYSTSITNSGLGVITNDTSGLLTVITNTNVANITWKGLDFAWSSANSPAVTDTFAVFNRHPSAMPPGTIGFSLAGPTETTSEYDTLLVCISPPSSRESDSKLDFRQYSFWYAAAPIISGLRTGSDRNTLQLVGRYVIADTFVP